MPRDSIRAVHAIPAGIFCLIKRTIDTRDEIIEGFVCARFAHAYAGGYPAHRADVPATEGLAQGLAETLGLMQPGFGRQDRKFLAAPAADRVRLTRTPGQRLPD